jgi:hypothetical protein
MMNVWIQRHDFSSEERDDLSLKDAERILRDFDWLSEREKQSRSVDGGCDPGLGLVRQDGRILHICPGPDDRCYLHYHYPETRKILGFIPVTRQGDHFIPDYSLDEATELMALHFDGQQDEILKRG